MACVLRRAAADVKGCTGIVHNGDVSRVLATHTDIQITDLHGQGGNQLMAAAPREPSYVRLYAIEMELVFAMCVYKNIALYLL